MAWTIEYAETARKQLRKLDSQTARRVADFMRERVANSANPRDLGRPLVGLPYWRYRVGDYRILCQIEDGQLRVLVLEVGNRREVYR